MDERVCVWLGRELHGIMSSTSYGVPTPSCQPCRLGIGVKRAIVMARWPSKAMHGRRVS